MPFLGRVVVLQDYKQIGLAPLEMVAPGDKEPVLTERQFRELLEIHEIKSRLALGKANRKARIANAVFYVASASESIFIRLSPRLACALQKCMPRHCGQPAWKHQVSTSDLALYSSFNA